MKILLSIVTALLFCVNAGAAQPGPALEALLAAAPEQVSFRADIGTPTQTSAELVQASNWELFQFGAKTFELEGSTLALKLAYFRGQYDPFAKTFKAQPSYILSDLTAGANSATYWRVRPVNSEPQQFNLGPKKEISIRFDKNVFSILIRDKDSYFSEALKVTYQELRELWENAAWAFFYDLNGKEYYFVPQVTWDGTVTRTGFVLSEGSPYYYTSSMPIDYVELSRYQDGLATYAPTGYSIPTELAFDYSPAGVWTARKMTAAEWEDQAQILADSDRSRLGPVFRPDNGPRTIRSK